MAKASGSEVPAGTVRLVQGTPNPNGAEDAALFLLAGDPTSATIREIVPDEGATPPPPGLADLPFRLSILHFNDLHGQVSRATPHGNHAVLARMVWRVKELRRLCRADRRRGVLFLSGGDDLVGAALGELLADDPSLGRPAAIHAGYHLYSAAGVDAGVLGNHDLDLGTRLLARAIDRDARFPVLAANLRATPALTNRIYPAALLAIKGIRVGLIGLTTPAQITCAGESGVSVTHPLAAVQNLLPAFGPLCDVLIVLSHLGRSLASNTASTRDAGDVELASSLPTGSVHLIVGGHTHEALNEYGLSIANVVNGIPIVQAGTRGRFLGEVEITIDRGTASRCSASVANVHLTATADLPADENFEREQIQPLLERTGPLLARRLGRVADNLDLSSDAVRDGFAAGESALANFVADALVSRCRAAGHAVDLAAIDASTLCCGLPVGCELTFGDWFKVMPYADTIRICEVTGRQLAGLLDDNARRADLAGEPRVERGFLQFSAQVRYTIEQGKNRSAAWAANASVDGLPLDRQLERTFLVACTSFMREAAAPWERYAAGTLGLTVLRFPGGFCAETGLQARATLVEYVREHGGVTEAGGARRDGRVSIVRGSVESTP